MRGGLSNSLLNSQQVLIVVSIFTQTPGHDTSQAASLYDFCEFLGNEGWGVPGPEDVWGRVPEVQATILGVRDAVVASQAPGIADWMSCA